MIQALGYAQTTFCPSRPGRLCRSRERWIEPWPEEAGEQDVTVHRLVLSGAAFEDDSASQAQRGLQFSGLSLASVVQAIVPRRKLVAFCEDGHPADIPEKAEHVEMFTGYRAGGLSEELRVRWLMSISGVRDLRRALGEDVLPLASGLVCPQSDATPLDEDLQMALFQLTGWSTVDSPPARFQPSAIPALLERCRAVILFHRDKHGPAVGVYSAAPLPGVQDRLVSLAQQEGALPVRFAIPPMLARWDRALSEARAEWLESRSDPFPVPAAPDRGGASSREADRAARRRALSRRGREAGSDAEE